MREEPSAAPSGPDLWALAPIAATIAVAARAWFTRIGEPFADDFDFLTHVARGGGWLDGGGSRFYWRPVARQLYYRVFGDAMLAHPAWVATLQAACLALAGWLLYRTWRRCGLGGAVAATAACIPLLLEPARALIAWPTMFQDLGALLFVALALHEATASRLVTSLLAFAAGLLCKEVALVGALLLPWLPRRTASAHPSRVRWAVAALIVVGAWAAVYALASRHAGLLFARDAVHDTRALAVPWLERWIWAMRESLTDTFDLGVLPSLPATIARWALDAVAGVALALAIVSGTARERLRRNAPWIALGLVWFALASATLADVYPDWRPYRSPFAAAGVGVAIAAALGAVHPGLLAALAAVRFAGFALAPGPPAVVVEKPTGRYSIDYAQIVRLQRLVGESRDRLIARRPPPAPGLRAARHFFPPTALFAYDGDRSLQAWYRDSTARWLTVSDASKPGAVDPVILEYQPPGRGQVTYIVPAALWHLERGARWLDTQKWDSTLVEVRIADSLQVEPGSFVFASLAAGKRALALGGLDRNDEAVAEARRAIALWPLNDDARYVVMLDHLRHGRTAEGAATLDTLMRANPGDATLQRIFAETQRARSPWSGRTVSPIVTPAKRP